MDSRTALVILPPEELMNQVQAIRRQHDRAFERWPPHLRICWPFVALRRCFLACLRPETAVRLAEERLRKVSRPPLSASTVVSGRLEVASFDLELSQLELLSGGGDRDRTPPGRAVVSRAVDRYIALTPSEDSRKRLEELWEEVCVTFPAPWRLT